MEQIDTISRADQLVKDIQGALATASATAPKKQMSPRLVHLRQSFPDSTSFNRAHEIANRIRKIVLLLYKLAPSRIWPKLSCQEAAILDMRSTPISGEVPRPIRALVSESECSWQT
ncbi:hypothetical protein WJX77_012296 [Trebouxia sp. C0004]